MSNFFKRWGPATALTVAGALIGTPGFSQIVDGTRDGSYPAALAVQTIDTNFGNNNVGSQTLANGSEVDNIHAQIVGTDLFIMVGGNLESNFNKLVLFFDSKTGGQNQITGAQQFVGNMNGLRFDAGFLADYALSVTCGNNPLEVYANYAPVTTSALATDFIGGGPGRTQSVNFSAVVSGAGTGDISVDNSNTAGVGSGTAATAGNPGAVSTGVEFRIPLSALGATVGGGDIKVHAHINNGGWSFLANQVLAGLPAGTNNLGAPSGVNLNAIAGSQFVTVANGVVVVTNPEIDLAPSSINFFNVAAGSPAVTRTVDVSNNGTAPLTVTNVTSNNPRFSASPTAFTVAPGGTQLVVVSYNPGAAGPTSGTLRFFSNDPVTPQATMTVFGNSVGAGQIIVDGTRDASYGTALSLQNNTTGFGDNQSELDGVYARIIGNKVHLMITGNLENGGNRIVLFLDNSPKFHNSSFSAAAWPSIGNSDRLDNLTFDPGFSPEYMLVLNTGGGSTFADFAEIGTANSFFLGSASPTSQTLTFPSGGIGELAVNNTNSGGVNGTVSGTLGNPGAVTTGFELVIPLADIAPGYSAATPLRLMAFISNNSYDFLSNQVLGGIGGGSPAANVANIGDPNGKSFATMAGTQFVTLQRGDVNVLNGETVNLMGDFRFVTVQTGGILQAFGALDVSQSLRVLGGTLDLASQGATVSGAGLFSLQAGTLSVASPAGLTTSGVAGALQNTGSRTLNAGGAYRFDVTGASGVTGNALPGTVRELAAVQTAGPANTLTLSQNVNVTEAVRALGANINLDSRILRLMSDAATQTALIENNGGAVIGSTGKMESALNPTFRGTGYRHYSSPFSGMTVGGLATFGFTPIVDAAYNSPTPPTYTNLTFPNVFFFDETLATTNFVAGYQSPSGLGDAMTVGRGYAVRVNGTPEVVFAGGAFTTGNQTVALTRTGSDPNNSGWNMTGNPFPSPLDWDQVTIPGGMSGQVSVQSPLASSTANGGVYLTRIGGTGTLPSGVIPAAQGVFVRRTAGAGSFTFEQSARVTTVGGPTTHYRSTDTRPLLRLALEGTARLTGMVDEAIVYFENGATSGQDDRFDATRVAFSSGDAPSISTRLANGALAQVDGRPVLMQDVEIPLDVRANVAGVYVLNARLLTNFAAGQPVLLIDALTGTTQDLRAISTYRCQLDPAATGPRFSLRFGAGVTGVASDVANALLSVYPNPSTGNVTVEWAGASALTGSVTITDLLGRVVREQPAGAARLTLTNLPKGVYSLRVQSTDGPLTRRIVVE